MFPVNSLFKVQASPPYVMSLSAMIVCMSLAFDSLVNILLLHSVAGLPNLTLARPSLVFYFLYTRRFRVEPCA